MLIASVCFLDPPNELPRHGQGRGEEEEEDDDEAETQFQREDDPVHKDRSVKFNFPSFSSSPPLSLFLPRSLDLSALSSAAPDGEESREGFNKVDKSDCAAAMEDD